MDVFFVISGYLISSAVIREVDAGVFTFSGFYERRIRRIFPALIVMLAVVSAMAYRFLLPSELSDFAGSMIAAISSYANLWFSRQPTGYFAAPSSLKPLLHTWSLGVEEQFYFVMPILVVIVARFARRQLKACVLTLAMVSFLFSIYYVRQNPTLAFYLAPLRAWELLIGTIVSQKYLPTIHASVGRNLASAAGFLLILTPALLYRGDTPFPGLEAIPPCLGAALIIAAGETGPSVVGRLLSLRPVVFVGLISYSFYLWHWPLIVFNDLGSLFSQLPASDRRIKAFLFVVSIIVATISWRFVETPFRKGRLRPGRKSLFVVTGLSVAMLVTAGVLVLQSRGLPGRFPQPALDAAGFLSYKENASFREGTCFIGVEKNDQMAQYDRQVCLPESPGKTAVLIMGDSHAAQLWSGIHTVYPELAVQQATVASCPLYLDRPADSLRPACKPMADFLYHDYLPKHPVDVILWGQRWNAAMIPEVARTLSWMKHQGFEVYLVGPTIEYDSRFPRVLALSLRQGNQSLIESHQLESARQLDRDFASLAREQWHVGYLSYFQTLCQPDCPSYGAPGVPLMFDYDHLTAAGSTLFFRDLRESHQLPW